MRSHGSLASDANGVIQPEQHGSGEDASGHRDVGADHGVLDGVGDEQNYGEVEGGHLADLPLAADAQADQDREVHNRRSRDDL